VDENKLMAFVGRAVGDLGALVNGALVVVGDRLGLYRALAGAGPLTAGELAERTGTTERYVREWLSAQAAHGYLEHHDGDRFLLPDEHAVALTDETSPACVVGGFELGLAAVQAADPLTEAFRSGAGIGWGRHHHDVFEGCERFFRPGYRANLVASWLPALDGVEDKLRRGIRVADVGCGHGASTLLMAEAYPTSSFVGIDVHEPSIEEARKRASAAGLADRVDFEVGTATTFGGPGAFDLVCFFDSLHDMGDPAGACAHARSVLDPDGTLMLVEPFAGDRVADNLHPVGAAYYAFSTLLCTPNSLSEDVGAALGAQAGEARLAEVVTGAGFASCRRVAETPFNMVLEARP
jgi:SAM-dependent methyltransferase